MHLNYFQVCAKIPVPYDLCSAKHTSETIVYFRIRLGMQFVCSITARHRIQGAARSIHLFDLRIFPFFPLKHEKKYLTFINNEARPIELHSDNPFHTALQKKKKYYLNGCLTLLHFFSPTKICLRPNTYLNQAAFVFVDILFRNPFYAPLLYAFQWMPIVVHDPLNILYTFRQNWLPNTIVN